jgi:hypothetical protein
MVEGTGGPNKTASPRQQLTPPSTVQVPAQEVPVEPPLAVNRHTLLLADARFLVGNDDSSLSCWLAARQLTAACCRRVPRSL